MNWFKVQKPSIFMENVNDKSPVDANGQTPKEVAEEFNHLEIVKLFS